MLSFSKLVWISEMHTWSLRASCKIISIKNSKLLLNM